MASDRWPAWARAWSRAPEVVAVAAVVPAPGASGFGVVSVGVDIGPRGRSRTGPDRRSLSGRGGPKAHRFRWIFESEGRMPVRVVAGQALERVDTERSQGRDPVRAVRVEPTRSGPVAS